MLEINQTYNGDCLGLMKDIPDGSIEEWKPIQGFNSEYRISNMGRVFSVKSNKFLKLKKLPNGYLQVHLRSKKISKCLYVHRLVAAHFCENPFCLKEVNHLDENKENNTSSNLCWCTHLDNTRYGTRNIRVSMKKKNNPKVSFRVAQYDKMMNIINTYPSMAEAARQTGFLCGEISRACKGLYKTYKGFIWKRI